MASTRDIRRRIKSVKNTKQITKAMELVAASKMKRAQQSAMAGRSYATLMAEMLASLGGRRADVSQHPFLAEREAKALCILLLTSESGLCSHLIYIRFKGIPDLITPVKCTLICSKGAHFLVPSYRDLVADFVVHYKVPFSEVKVISEFITKQF